MIRLIATTFFVRGIQVWDYETKKMLKNIEENGNYSCINFSHNNNFIVSGEYNDCVNVWDVETGECLKILQGNSCCWISCVVFSADNNFIVACNYSAQIKLWDVRTSHPSK